MTTMINLLPWREERRKQRQHEFIAMLAFAALLAGLIFWLWKGMVEGQIADQQTRNNHIQSEIAKLDTQIKETSYLEMEVYQIFLAQPIFSLLFFLQDGALVATVVISPVGTRVDSSDPSDAIASAKYSM